MAESIHIPETVSGKRERYELLLPQLRALTENETDVIANVANVVAALHHSMGFFWTGVYFVKGNELVLGPFQGPVACTRIAYGKGVCGTAWQQAKTVLVEDVDAFPGHIACSSLSRSEVVVPVVKNGTVTMVIDADSDRLAAFDTTDASYLEEIARMMSAW